MKQKNKATHEVDYKMEDGYWHKQNAYGKTDLFLLIRQLMKDGYTKFGILTLKYKQ